MSKKRKRTAFIRSASFFFFLAAITATAAFSITLIRRTADSENKKKDGADESISENDGGGTDSETMIGIERPDSGQYIYISVENEDMLQSGSSAIYGDDYDAGQTNGLDSIYRFLFNPDGLQIASAENSDITGNPDALSALNEMLCDFYEETGLRTILIKECFTDSSEEICSADHKGGYGIDLGIYYPDSGIFDDLSDTAEYSWIYDNAYIYGFILLRSGEEDAASAAHFRYVGKAAAEVIDNDQITLEEFDQNIKSFSFEEPLSVTVSGGDVYLIYYIQASDGKTTDIKLYSYSDGSAFDSDISGNGSDGYIITVKTD